MDFEPVNGPLYLTIGSSIMVVQVNDGGEPGPTCPKPLTGVPITGPSQGEVDTTYTFCAEPTPSDATLPVTYTWSPQPLTGQGASIVTYQWATRGTYSISVTAENCGGTCSAVHAVRLGDWEHIFLPLVNR